MNPAGISFKTNIMKRVLCYVILIAVILCSCTGGTQNKSVKSNYELITAAIRGCQESRLQFQDAFAEALNSFLQNDRAGINFNTLTDHLNNAKRESENWSYMAESAEEVDSSLRYREAALAMFNAFDNAYNNCFPEIITLMKSGSEKDSELLKQLTVACHKLLKEKAKEVVRSWKMVVEKYNLRAGVE